MCGKNQKVRIGDISWCDPPSGQGTIELITSEGVRFTCYCEQSCSISEGDILGVDAFYYLEHYGEFEDLFAGNPKKEKTIEQLSEWDCYLKGQIVDVEGHDLKLDCGGVVIDICNVSSDKRVIGWWIGVRVERLEVEFRIERD